MKLKCFGVAKDIVDSSLLTIEEQDLTTVGELKAYLNKHYPTFSQYATYQIAVNHSIASDDQIISQMDELAIIPPVSGG